MLITELTTRKKIVLNRWRARQFYWEAWKSMPPSLEIRNDKNGERLAEEDRYEVSLSYTLLKLHEIGVSIFHKNFDNHYLGLSLEASTRISYASAPENKFDGNHRIKTRLGRYITRWFSETVSHDDFNERALDMLVEKFCALAAEDIDNMFEVVSGPEITMRYRDEFADDSCMTGSGAKYTQLYEKNPDVVSMLCMDDGKYRGRALLWNTDDGPVLDRIYPNSGPHIEKYEIYCKKHGIDMREHNYCPCSAPTDEVLPHFADIQTRKGETYSVRVKLPSSKFVPYMDLFHFGTWIEKDEEAQLYSCPTELGIAPDFVAASTGGDYSSYLYTDCDICAEHVFHHATDRMYDVKGERSDKHVCSKCIDQGHIGHCSLCSSNSLIDDTVLAEPHGRDNLTARSIRLCVPCAEHYMILCEGCNEPFGYHVKLNDKKYCESCYIKALAADISLTPLQKELAIKESIQNEFTQS